VITLAKKSKCALAEGKLTFEYDSTPAEEVPTVHAGIPLDVPAARSFYVLARASEHLRAKQRLRGGRSYLVGVFSCSERVRQQMFG
jgi:hypothetical protein